MTINKQALREVATNAKELGNISRYTKAMVARMEFKEAVTPDDVLALLDEVEGKEKQRAAANKVVVQQDIELQELRLRIAELEAREVVLPDYTEIYQSEFAKEVEHQVRAALKSAGIITKVGE